MVNIHGFGAWYIVQGGGSTQLKHVFFQSRGNPSPTSRARKSEYYLHPIYINTPGTPPETNMISLLRGQKENCLKPSCSFSLRNKCCPTHPNSDDFYLVGAQPPTYCSFARHLVEKMVICCSICSSLYAQPS